MSGLEDSPIWPPGGGELARRVNAHDWAATSLGPVEGWSDRLKVMVEIVLASPDVSCLVCGSDRILIYNDAAARLYGGRHPAALGRPLPETFPEGWATVAPLYARAFAGEAVQVAAQPLDTRSVGEATDTFDATLLPVHDDAGAVIAVHMTGREVGARTRAETALRESEERLRALVTATSYAIYSMSPDWTEMRRLEWHGFLADTPVPSKSWLGEYIHLDDQPAVREEIERAIRTKSVFDLEHRVRRTDGTLGWTRSRAVPLLDTAGGVREWFGAASDITVRKQAEAVVRESEGRLRGFGDASSDVLWIRDVDSLQWEYLTPAFEAIYGLSREEALRGNNLNGWAALILPEDREHALACIRQVGRGHRTTFEYRIRRPTDGQVRWLRDTDFPMHDATGQVRWIGGVGHDVTALKEIEAALAKSEGRLRALVEGMPQLVWRSAARGEWTWASPQWIAFTGLSDEASRGRGWLRALHPDDRADAMAAWDRAGEGGAFEADFRLRHAADGTWRWFHTRGSPVLRAPDGTHVWEWLGTSTDVDDQVRARDALERAAEVLEARVAERTAELRAAEASLHQAQKMEAVGQLTGGIAHDFNNMLQGVTSSVDMARRRVDAGYTSEAGRYLEAAHAAVDRAAGLTRRLLAFARRQNLEPKPLDADALVADMADLIRRSIGPGITLDLQLRNGGGSVLCDPNELENVLLNLCINSRDAMPSGGRLVINTEDVELSAADVVGQGGAVPGGYVAMCVSDTGSGMPPDVLEHVFEPFFTTKPVGQGTGLGLSQVWGFVRQLAGFLQIESTLGQGTTVRLFLPRSDWAATTEKLAPTPMPEQVGPGDATVLLVDDEAGVRSSAAERLQELGFRVLEAADGMEALLLLAKGARPDLLITDVGLPSGMNGRQLAEAMQGQIPGLPVLFITGYAAADLPPEIEVIHKPFTLNELAQRVQVLLTAGRQGPGRNLGA
ncbi:PAS domain-containing protein [Belnapia sp. T18]|uniref:histidine kinase n=1 Tax=Belnapia arida TaxID=2804533 RepID=A0ABS1UCE9_9PROT|nr:PAS domain-containing protein [Belnapia arida]MBL6082334.1 PAS domain-containing protein [Belnapia arida]